MIDVLSAYLCSVCQKHNFWKTCAVGAIKFICLSLCLLLSSLQKLVVTTCIILFCNIVKIIRSD